MMKSKNLKIPAAKWWMVLLFPVLSFSPLGAQEAPAEITDSTTILFQSDEILYLTLSMDIKKVIHDIEELESHPAEISYTDQEGKDVKIPLNVKVRGNFRKDPVHCNFPPLRLNFSDSTVKKTVFEGLDKVKLVTHCRTRKDVYEQNVFKEYLAYKLYNLFTEESFKVRLVHLTYVDNLGKMDTLEKIAFLIEPNEQMARRNDCEILKVKNILQERTDRHKITVLSVFQFMIGNTDWSVTALHNIVLLKEFPEALPVAVPYDFDWCGLVNAPYAVPSEQLPIESVRIRYYRGFCRPDQELQLVLKEFIERKDEIYKTCNSIPHMTEKDVNNTNKYMDQFFQTIENPKAIEIAFHKNCRTK